METLHIVVLVATLSAEAGYICYFWYKSVKNEKRQQKTKIVQLRRVERPVLAEQEVVAA